MIEIEDNYNNWEEHAKNYKPIIDAGRKSIPLLKHPKDLDFTKSIGNTEYIVKSKFDKNANECLIGIVLRWVNNNTDVS